MIGICMTSLDNANTAEKFRYLHLKLRFAEFIVRLIVFKTIGTRFSGAYGVFWDICMRRGRENV